MLEFLARSGDEVRGRGVGGGGGGLEVGGCLCYLEDPPLALIRSFLWLVYSHPPSCVLSADGIAEGPWRSCAFAPRFHLLL